MKVNTKETTRKRFIAAVSMAKAVKEKLHPKTRLAHWCEQFIEVNESEIEKHNKKAKDATSALERELKRFKINHALEIDGAVQYTSEGHFKFSKENTIKVEEKAEEINEKIEEKVSKLLEEKVKVKYFTDKLELSDKIEPFVISALQGFVFCNEHEFKELPDAK